MTKQPELLPSIPVYDPSCRVVREIGAPTHGYPNVRVALRPVNATADYEQHLREVQGSETFWRLTWRNRP
jgi:hypothetical protein